MREIYTTEVITKTLSVKDMMDKYCKPEVFIEACKLCPSYGKRWSCPPDLKPTAAILDGYSTVVLSAVKVIYPDSDIARSRVMTPEQREAFREETYGVVKQTLNDSMLAMEKIIPGSMSIAAGECKRCKVCAREEGKPCRYPDLMRYSFSALGFDITNMVKETMNLELLWSADSVPEYVVAAAALFIR